MPDKTINEPLREPNKTVAAENILSLEDIVGKNDTIVAVDRAVSDVFASEYDGLFLPGGAVNPDTMRMNQDAVSFVKEFSELKKPVAAICHAPWLLVEADVLEGCTLTSWPSIKTDIINAGGDWIDSEVIVDDWLVTSRKPDDIPVFTKTMIEEFHRTVAEPALDP